MMRFHLPIAMTLGAVLLTAACSPEPTEQANAPAIKVRGLEQDRLHQLGAFDLAIGLKRAIYEAGYTCKQLTDAGFIGTHNDAHGNSPNCLLRRERELR